MDFRLVQEVRKALGYSNMLMLIVFSLGFTIPSLLWLL